MSFGHANATIGKKKPNPNHKTRSNTMAKNAASKEAKKPAKEALKKK
ncbi:MAG: hypothetical protein KBC06_02960 [Candidatus Pacebacteria bacterium]|nr:hypothetical protein [Candidatus Paceibacterota bacterium]